MAIRSAWSAQEYSLSITYKREMNFDLVSYKLYKIKPELEDLIVKVFGWGFSGVEANVAAQLISDLSNVSPIYLVR